MGPPYFIKEFTLSAEGPPNFLGVFTETIHAHPAGLRIAAHWNLLQLSKLALMGTFCLAVDHLPFHCLLLLLPVALHLLQVTES